jgi:hypothetical protein
MRYRPQLLVWCAMVVCVSASLPSFAQPNETYTANVVGFRKITAVSSNYDGYTLASTPFYQDAATPEAANLDHVIGANGVAGETPDVADNVLLYDPLNFLSHFSIYWLYFYPGDDEFNWKWLSAMGMATNVYLRPSEGFWYINRSVSDLTITLAGNVVNAPAITNKIFPGYQLLSYPFSAPVCMTDLTLTNGLAGETPDVADNIMLYDSTNVLAHFTIYWLYYYPGDDEFNGKWLSANGVATNVFIQPGQGFWYVSRLNTTNQWVEEIPYTL